MHNKRLILICLIAALAVAIAATVLLVVLSRSGWSGSGPSTNDVYYYEDDAPHADPEIVGMWQNVQNPQWFKVYYDDYDSDGYYWGKEWDEADDVFEEDLSYHGNGWFRWRKEGKNLKELHTMDISGATVPKQWRYKTKPDSLLLYSPENKKRCDRFGRVGEP